jgi:hypothetical protein
MHFSLKPAKDYTASKSMSFFKQDKIHAQNQKPVSLHGYQVWANLLFDYLSAFRAPTRFL